MARMGSAWWTDLNCCGSICGWRWVPAGGSVGYQVSALHRGIILFHIEGNVQIKLFKMKQSARMYNTKPVIFSDAKPYTKTL